MKNKLKILVCITALCFCHISSGKIITTYSVTSQTMKNVAASISGKDNVVFINLDDVLTIPESLMFSYGANPYRTFIEDMVSLGKTIPAYDRVVAKWYQQRSLKLVEKEWVDFVKKLEEKNVTIYGIYSAPIHLLNMQEKLYQDVQNLGITFTDKVNDKEHFIIEREGRWGSMFYKGIITTVPYSKSHTMMEFLRITNLAPHKLVFIDNMKKELKRVDKMLRVFDMENYNVLYLGAQRIAKEPDERVVKLQQDTLINTGKWLEDDEAARILQEGEQGER